MEYRNISAGLNHKMSNKTVLVFIFPNCMGGVASFNRNLINYSVLKKSCHVRVVLLEPAEDKRPRFTDPIEGDEIVHFSFSNRENQYSVCSRLSKIIGEEQGCIIADNSLPLNTVGLFGSVKKMIYLVHDYFYIGWALHYHKVIDAVITHASFFRDILLAAGIIDFHDKVFYIPYGVELPPEGYVKPVNNVLKLVFLGRLIEEKGVMLLKDVDRHLAKKGVRVEWTIVGKGSLQHTLSEQWKEVKNIHFIQASDTQAVYSILQEQDILVFPSWFEGTPVSIMEALSRGVVPIVSDLPGGTRDMVFEQTGFRCAVKNSLAYANAIENLDRDRDKLKQMQEACMEITKMNYDINKAADAYFSFFLRHAEGVKKANEKDIVCFSSLDKEFIPNWMVYYLRTVRQYFTSGPL